MSDFQVSENFEPHITISLPGKGYLRAVQKSGGCCEVLDIFIEEAYRQKGYGRALINKLRSLDRGIIHVLTRRANGVARIFYQKLGMFEVVIPALYDDGDACLFVDRIRP
jgi:GNAT superfamily N-acetyltransferase